MPEEIYFNRIYSLLLQNNSRDEQPLKKRIVFEKFMLQSFEFRGKISRPSHWWWFVLRRGNSPAFLQERKERNDNAPPLCATNQQFIAIERASKNSDGGVSVPSAYISSTNQQLWDNRERFKPEFLFSFSYDSFVAQHILFVILAKFRHPSNLLFTSEFHQLFSQCGWLHELLIIVV